MSQQGQMQFQVVEISPWVKRLIIANVVVWVVFQLIIEKFLLPSPYITTFFSFTPSLVIENFMIWQLGSYMFLHSGNVFHILFNMISLWFFGSELEYRWGWRSFLIYYFVTGVGAALIYLIGVILVGLIYGSEPSVWNIPVIGASGAIFGILVAYGILFGERMIHFMLIFPMKAKYFIMILGGVELVTLLNEGMGGSQVANLAHVGGMVSGFVYLLAWTRIKQKQWRKNSKKSKGRRNLRLVINNDEDPDDPKYWN